MASAENHARATGAIDPAMALTFCLLNPCNVVAQLVGHITACYCRHDSDILLTLRRLELESDHVKTARIIHSAPLLHGSGASYRGIEILIYS